MSTRMQQRRGTASQWISTNGGNGPILAAGELGFESDTNKFKIGDGINHWIDLDYFADINSATNPSFGSSITFEGTTANAYETTLAITDPTADRTITFPDSSGTVALTTDIPTLDTDDVSEGSTNKYFTDERAQDAVGNALGSGLSYDDSTGAVSVNTTTIQARVADVSDTEIGYLNGVTSGIQSQLDDKADLSGATFTGTIYGTSLELSGDLTVNGTYNSVPTETLTVTNPMIYMADDNPANLVDIGFVGSHTISGTYSHTGLVLDATDGKWKLFKGVTDEPTTTVNFAQGTLSTLSVGTLELTNSLGIAYGGTGLTSFTTGDLVYASGTDTLASLGVGTEGQILKVVSGVPAWGAAGGSGGAAFSEFMLIGA